MTNHDERWIGTVDDRRARLFHGERMPGGSWQFEEIEESLSNMWEDSHERGRPSMLGMRGPGGQTHHAAGKHDDEETRRRFATEVNSWLLKRSEKFAPAPLVLFASSKLVGELRKRITGSMENRVRIVEAELTRLRPGELGDHPAVVGELQEAFEK